MLVLLALAIATRNALDAARGLIYLQTEVLSSDQFAEAYPFVEPEILDAFQNGSAFPAASNFLRGGEGARADHPGDDPESRRGPGRLRGALAGRAGCRRSWVSARKPPKRAAASGGEAKTDHTLLGYNAMAPYLFSGPAVALVCR